MDIPKNESYRDSAPKAACVGLCICILAGICVAKTSSHKDTPASIANLPMNLTPESAHAIVESLKTTVDASDSIGKTQETQYQIGLIYFRTGNLRESQEAFRQVAGDAGCSRILRACAHNMIGQINRLRNDDNAALEAFEDLIDQIPRDYSKKGFPELHSKLLSSAHISRAEIYQKRCEHELAAKEYTCLLEKFKANALLDDQHVAAMLHDRLAQQWLHCGKTERYRAWTEKLISEFPTYYRTGLAELELACINCLNEHYPDLGLVKEHFQAPAILISQLAGSTNRQPKEKLRLTLEGLEKKYKNPFASVILGYHKACLLEALGEKRSAIVVLAEVADVDLENRVDPARKDIVQTVQAYAKIKRAILLSEDHMYARAIEVLATVENKSGDPHISQLVESVSNRVHTLKREVSAYD